MATARQTQVLYITYFARPADPSGLDYWSSGDRLSQPLKQTAEGFATTPEFAASIAGLTNGQVIDKYYENLFGRQRQAGETYWLDKVNNGQITLAEAGYWISQGAQGQDKVTLDAKLAAADEWTVAVRANPDANFNYNGELAATLGVAFLAPVLGPATIPSPQVTRAAVAAIPAFGTIGFIEASTLSVTEGSTVIFSLQTIPSLAGQFLNYEIVGSGGLTAADIEGGVLTGSIRVDANGVASLAVTVALDAVIDPGESFTLVIPNAISAPAVAVVNTTVPSLTVTPQPTGVTEGESITFLIASNAIVAGTVLNYTITGVQAADVIGPLTGTVVVGAGGTVPSVVVQIATDLTIETETLQFSITGGGATGTASVVIQDTSPPAQIIVAAQPSSVSEGQTLTYLINTTGIAVGTTLTYQITGISAADVLGGAAVLSGTRTVGASGAVNAVVIQIAEDLVLNEQETATITVTNGVVTGTAAATVVDTTPLPALSVTPQPTGVNEGESVTFLIASAGIAEGTVLSYIISGVQPSDVVGPLAGTVVVGAAGTVPSVVVQIATDLTIETETLQFSISGGGATGTASVVIQDTSPPAQIIVAAQPSSVAEGQTLTYLINTTGIAVGTTLTYQITGISAADVLGGAAVLSGTRTVGASGLVDSVVIQIAQDLVLNEQETATITVTNGVITGTAAATIVDTTPAPLISLQTQPNGSVNEGSSIDFLIGTIGIAPGTVLSYQYQIGTSPIVSGTTTVAPNGTVPAIQVLIPNDNIPGETQSIVFAITGGGASNGIVVPIIDTTATTYDLTVNPDTYNFAGATVPIAFNGSTVPGGLYGFNTLQNVDSLAGGSARDTLTAQLVGGGTTAPRALYSIEEIAISSLPSFFGGENVLDLVSTADAVNFPVSTLERLVNFNSSEALRFTNIPGFGPTGLPSVLITGTNFATTLEFQPVALTAPNQTLTIDTNRAGVNNNPLAIRLLQTGVENAIINDRVLVSDRQIDYDLIDFNVPSVAINSPNSVDLFDRVNLNTVVLDGSGIQGSFTVDLSSQAGGVSIAGGPGNDTITSRQGSSTLAGNGGDDTLTGLGGSDSIDGGTGSDLIIAGGGNNYIIGGFGDDLILAAGGNDTVFGNEGADSIVAGAGNNSVSGGAGADVIVTLAGNDNIFGGEGADTINSGDGNDNVAGEAGDDSITFGNGSDTVSGGLGNDYFKGNVDISDRLDGNEGTNTLEITAANADTIANTATPFSVRNFSVLNVSGTIGADVNTNQVNIPVFDTTSTIFTLNILQSTGATPASFVLNSGASTVNINGSYGGATTFTAIGSGLNDSITLNGNGGNFLNGQDFTFVGFDSDTIYINTGTDPLVTQTIGTLTIDPTGDGLAHVDFEGAGSVSINTVTVVPASNLLLDFSQVGPNPLTGFGDITAEVDNISVGGVGSDQSVLILGSTGNDIFTGDLTSANTIFGNDGNDLVVTGSNNDYLDGGAGRDTLDAGSGSDTVYGASGNDRVIVGSNLSINDIYDGGSDFDTIQLTGIAGIPPYPVNPVLVQPFTQGYTASQLASVTNFEALELDVPANGIQDLYNFATSGNILTTVNLTDNTGAGLGDAYLYNAPSTLTNLGILESLDTVQLFRRVDTASDSLTVTFANGSDLNTLQVNDEESLVFNIDGATVINTLSAVDLTSLEVDGNGSLIISNPIVATGLATLDLSGLFTSAALDYIDASLSTANMVVTGPSNSFLNATGFFQLYTGSGNDLITSTSNIANTIDSDGGNDTIITDGNSDRITSGVGNDSVDSGAGDDTVFAGAGNDTVIGGFGNDLLEGDPNNDSTNGPAGNDSLSGGEGNDTLIGGLGADTIDGGVGIDTYVAGLTVSSVPPTVQDPANTGRIVGQLINLSTVTIDANAVPFITSSQVSSLLNDVQPQSTLYLYNIPLLPPLFGSTVSDSLLNIENVVGTNGNDYIIGSGDVYTPVIARNTQATQNVLDGGDGDDTYQGGYGQDSFINLSGSDFILDLGLVASPGVEDIIVGVGAFTEANLGDSWAAGVNTVNDGGVQINLNGFNANLSAATGSGYWKIYGTEANESVIGSGNGDFISMGDGNDTVIGGNGDDTIDGGNGNDSIDGSGGNDSLIGGSGNDSIFGSAGSDTIDGGDGNDSINGGIGPDSIEAGFGDDTVDSALNDNTIFTGFGQDSVLSAGSFNLIDTGADNDTIVSSGSSNTIDAGLGEDFIGSTSGNNNSFQAGAGNDTIEAFGDSNTLDGSSDNDLITITGQLNSILGGLGDDTIVSALGSESQTIDGGLGNDSINFDYDFNSIQGNAGNDTVIGNDSWFNTIDGGAGNDLIVSGDLFSGFYNILDGGLGEDTIQSDGDLNTISGGQGDDSISSIGDFNIIDGGIDEDFINSFGDNNTVSGGDGNDTINVDGSANAVDGGLGNDVINVTGPSNTVDGGAGNDFIVGSESDDCIFGNSGNDTIFSLGGNDTIDAGDGDDSVDSGAGDDSVIAGLGNDSVGAGLGDDNVTGDAGSDVIAGGDGNDTIDGGADADFLKGEAGNDSILGGAGADIITGEAGNDYIDGQADADTITGDTGSDSILGGSGDDSIDSGSGDDTIAGGFDNDSIFGQAGSDIIDGNDGNDSIDAGADDDTIDGGANRDSIFGGLGADSIFGQNGEDSIDGGAGNDSIFGGNGADTIFGSTGLDSIDGGSGNDSINAGADADNVDGGANDDSIFTEAGADSIFGNGGNDSIDSGADADTVDGGFGNDSIFTFAGADTINGNDGNDSIDSGVDADVVDGGANDDSIFSGAGADSVFGNAGNDSIDAGADADTVDGGSENDTILGQAGADTIAGNTGDDSIDGGTEDDTINGGAGTDFIIGGLGNDVIDGGTEADSIHGNEGTDSILGDAGDDSIHAGAGADTVAGGDNNDYIDGGTEDDTLMGNAGNDTIFGQAGNDSIAGGEGVDSIDGGLDNDTINGEAGSDNILGGFGNDVIDAGADDDSVTGNEGDDSITAGAGADTVNGNAGNDTIAGGLGADFLRGGQGNDTILGNEGNDTINGDLGNDSLNGGADDDTLTGGGGIDTFIIDAGTDQITDLGFDALNEIVQVSSGAKLTAALGGAWTATAASSNNGQAVINTGDGNPLNLVAVTGTTGWTVVGSGTGNSVIGSNYNDGLYGAAGTDTLDGFVGNDTLNGGSEADVLTGGFGLDKFEQGPAEGPFATASDLTMMLTNGDTTVFGGGVDFVTDFSSPSDVLDWTGGGTVNALSGLADTNMATVGDTYWAFGDYVGTTFTYSTTGDDVLFFQAVGADLDVGANIGAGIVLNGASASWNAATNIV